MRNESNAAHCPVPATDFLGALEEFGILPEPLLREVREGFREGDPSTDGRELAGRLVQQGTLTDFQAHRLLVGKGRSLIFGRYVLLDRLGVGAMGRVFKARHRLMDRVVALKVVLPFCAGSKNSVARFFREMKIVGVLDHPNVVRAYDADQQGDSPYIVMEYLEGEDLEKVLRRRDILPVQEVVDWMIQVARGLAHAHEKGVIHRDIKPTNLFLDRSGVVKVLDLGLGAFVRVSNKALNGHDTDEGFAVGTSDYMSPEQLNGQEVTERTDQFSLGCAMYRLLTGKFAFPGPTKMDRLVRRVQHPHVPITDVRKQLPVPLVAVLDRLLALRPEERFLSAAEAADELEILLPVSERRKSSVRGNVMNLPARPATATVSPEPEHPVDWSLIESALQPKRDRTRLSSPSTRGVSFESLQPRPAPASTHIDSHRKNLEADGVESGRSVQREYRKQVIQLKRDLSDQATGNPEEEPPSIAERWFEHFGEHLGDFLSEPRAIHIIGILGVLTIFFALGFAYVLS